MEALGHVPLSATAPFAGKLFQLRSLCDNEFRLKKTTSES